MGAAAAGHRAGHRAGPLIDVPLVDALSGPAPPNSSGPGECRSAVRGHRLLMALVRGMLTDRSAFLLLAQVSVALVAMLANILASRTLQATGRGELALLLQLAYLGSLVVVLGTDRSLVTVFAGAPVHVIARAQVRLLVRPATAAVTLAAVSVWGLPLVGLGAWRMQFVVTALFLVSNAFVRSTRAVAIAGHRQRDFLVATVVEQVLLLGALCLLAVTGIDAVAAWVGAYLLTALGPAAAYLVWWARGPMGITASDAAGRTGEVRREGLQLLPSSLASSGMLRVDRILLAAMASTAALGHYAAIGTFTELLTWPLIAFADNRTGGWRALHDTGRLDVRVPLLAAAAFVLAGSVLTAACTALLLPLLGPGFTGSRGLIPPLVAAAAVLGLNQIVLALLIARRCNSWASASDTTGFVVSLVAYVTLIPGNGAVGAAWGSLIGYGVCLAVGLGALLRRQRPRRPETAVPAVPVAPAEPEPAPSGGRWSGLLLIVVALAGRYTLDRAGYRSPAWIDLRLLGLVLACALVAVEARACGGLRGGQPGGWLIAALLLFGYQTLSVGWAPHGADAAGVVDVLALAALTTAVYLHARTWPQVAGRRVLWLLWTAGVVFGVGAFLVTGPGDQGRYAAFGGGPNVFVRIEILGLIAAIALVRTGASRHLLWSVPLLLAGAVMSGSRGGLLAAAIVGLVALVALAGGRRRAVGLGTLAGVGVGVTAVLAYRWGLPGSRFVRDRFVDQTLAEGYVSDRPVIFQEAMRLAQDHPLTGSGLGGFRVSVGERLGVEYAHNYLLSVAAEGGVVGSALLGTVVVLWWRTMVRARRWDTVTTGLVAAAAFVALASLVSGDYYDSRFAWCCAAVAVAGTVSPGTVSPGTVSPGTRQSSGASASTGTGACAEVPAQASGDAAG